MSTSILFLSAVILIVILTMLSIYTLNHQLKKYKVKPNQLEEMTKKELHESKPMILPKTFLYFLVSLTYKDMCKDNQLTVGELRDLILKDEGASDAQIVPHRTNH